MLNRRLDLAGDIVGNVQIVALAARAKTPYNAGAILHFAVLTHFPFAFETRDGEAEADDAAQHGIDVGLGRVGDRPRLAFALSCCAVNSPTWRRSQSASFMTSGRP